jgi:thiol-disulfide isomerase/thioredoxin
MKLKLTFSLLIILLVISCSNKNERDYQKPNRVVIAGKVLNFNPKLLSVKFNVNRIGFNSIHIEADLDNEGNFLTTFNSYTPTDVWIRYKEDFLVLTHPGDSLYIEFIGNSQKRTDVFKTIKFGGKEAKINREAAELQSRYYSLAYTDPNEMKKAITDYNAYDFRSYLDSNQTSINSLFEQFVTDVNPGNETKIWAKEFLNSHTPILLSFYPLHQYYNNLPMDSLHLPDGFFNPILTRSPVDKSMFISGYAMSNYLNNYLSAYVREYKLVQRAKQIDNASGGKKKDGKTYDSLFVYGLMNSTSDTLLKQMLLTELFSERINYKFDIETFEKYQEVAKKNIKEPFLWEPLYELYQLNKQKSEDQLSSSKINKVSKTSDFNILDSIIGSNKGKVIYLDCWATWCGPCIAEMPNSKVLMEELQDKEVVFAFLCLHSEKKDWQPTIDKIHIGGQHYFLSKKQSMDFAKFYAINGVPNYMLIDKKGNIVEQGTDLRPNVVKEKIEKLLKK